jgi:hypothetical protein
MSIPDPAFSGDVIRCLCLLVRASLRQSVPSRLASSSASFTPDAAIHSICIPSFHVHSFLHSFTHTTLVFFHSFIPSLTHSSHSFTHSFIQSLIHSYSFIHPSTDPPILSSTDRLFTHTTLVFFHSFIPSLIHSLTHSFISSFIHSLTHSFIH